MSLKENLSKLAKTVTDNAGTVAKTVSDSASTVVKTVGDWANVVVKKSGEIVELSKLTVSIKAEESKIKDLYEEIGKIVYTKFKNNVYIDPELTEKCKEIIIIEKDVHEMNAKISVLKNKKVCTKCGDALEKDAPACTNCGNEHTWEAIDAATKDIGTKSKSLDNSIIEDEDKL